MSGSIDAGSLAGTWIAAGLAIVALVGIIGPLYALRAASSAKNRALNSVWDSSGRYIQGGVPIGNRKRMFIRYHVPNLAPNYHENSPPVAAILPNEHFSEYSFLESIPEALLWNTGWTRLCALIQSHYKSPTGGKGMCWDSTGGTLEIIDARTALAVSRYWIFFLGLLGVYGKETDSSSNRLPQLRYTMYNEDDLDEASDTGEGTDVSTHTGELPQQYRTYYSRHGIRIFSGSPNPSISGSTGKFKSLGRQKHSLGLRDLVSFQYEGLGETSSVKMKQLSRTPFCSRLHDRFWLAFGFVSRRETEVISFCFSNPFQKSLVEESLSGFGHKRLEMPHLKLRESDNIPILLEQCRKSLRVGPIGEVPLIIFQWDLALDFEIGNDLWHEFPSRVYTSPHSGVRLRKGDLVRCLDAMFHLGWDAGGFLIERSSCDFWLELLHGATRKWYSDSWPEQMQAFFASLRLGQETYHKAYNWRSKESHKAYSWRSEKSREDRPYFASRIKDLFQFENDLDNLIANDTKWVKYLVAIAFVLDEDFQHAVLRVLKETQPGPSEERSSSLDSSEETSSSHSTEQSANPPSNFNYNMRSSVLSWEYPGGKRKETRISDFQSLYWMSATEVAEDLDISQRDIVLMSAWAATRCMLWTCSRDSASLIQFVNSLDRNVLIL